MFESLFTVDDINILGFFICLFSALLIGVFIAFLQTKQENYNRSFIITLALIPVVVAMVIMMVNGNVGAGVAVAGTFSLVRFRSQPGTAKEIGAIFVCMAAGLTIGMGYVLFAIIFTVVVSLFELFLSKYNVKNIKILKITIPEDLNYTNVFDDLFADYTNNFKLLSSRTTNLGSMFKLVYEINLKSTKNEKDFMDDLRCRNANLDISIHEFTNNSSL